MKYNTPEEIWSAYCKDNIGCERREILSKLPFIKDLIIDGKMNDIKDKKVRDYVVLSAIDGYMQDLIDHLERVWR